MSAQKVPSRDHLHRSRVGRSVSLRLEGPWTVSCTPPGMPAHPVLLIRHEPLPISREKGILKKVPKALHQISVWWKKIPPLHVCRRPEPTPTGNAPNAGPMDLWADTRTPGCGWRGRETRRQKHVGRAPGTTGDGLHPREPGLQVPAWRHTHIYSPAVMTRVGLSQSSEGLISKP